MRGHHHENLRLFATGPIEKFLKHRRIPFKLIANIVLVVFLACVTHVYVAPLQSVMFAQIHQMVTSYLSVGGEDNLPPSFESKWNGDYVDTPRILLRSLDDVQTHIVETLRRLSSEMRLLSVTMSITAPGLTTSDVQWDLSTASLDSLLSSNDNPELSAAKNISSTLANGMVLARLLNSTVGGGAMASRLPAPFQCNGGVAAEVDVLGGVRWSNHSCLPSTWWSWWRDDATRSAVEASLRARRFLQGTRVLSLSASWVDQGQWAVGSASEEAAGGINNDGDDERDLSVDPSIQRTWSLVMRWSWLGYFGASVRAECLVDVTTSRATFFSTDNEESPFDGYLVVGILFALLALCVADAVLRVRALSRIRLAGSLVHRTQRPSAANRSPQAVGSVNVGVNGADGGEDDVETDVSLATEAVEMLHDGANFAEEDRGDEAAPLFAESGATLPPWQAFLLRGKGLTWHVVAIAGDVASFVFVCLALCERSGVRMGPSMWTALQMSLAWAAFVHCVGLVSFLRFTPRAYLLIRATRHAVLRLLLMIVGILPIFLGFAFFFWNAFGAHSAGEFETFGSSVLALVFMMFGDNLLPAFRKIDGSRFWWMRAAADVAGCAYVAFFMGCVLNVVIAVVIDTYREVSRASDVMILRHHSLTRAQRETLKQQIRQEIADQQQLLLSLDAEDSACNDAEAPAVQPTGMAAPAGV